MSQGVRGREPVTPNAKAANGSPAARGLFSGYVGTAPHRLLRRLRRQPGQDIADYVASLTSYVVLALLGGCAVLVFVDQVWLWSQR